MRYWIGVASKDHVSFEIQLSDFETLATHMLA